MATKCNTDPLIRTQLGRKKAIKSITGISRENFNTDYLLNNSIWSVLSFLSVVILLRYAGESPCSKETCAELLRGKVRRPTTIIWFSRENSLVFAAPFLAIFLMFEIFQSKKLTEKFTKVKQAALITTFPKD